MVLVAVVVQMAPHKAGGAASEGGNPVLQPGHNPQAHLGMGGPQAPQPRGKAMPCPLPTPDITRAVEQCP